MRYTSEFFRNATRHGVLSEAQCASSTIGTSGGDGEANALARCCACTATLSHSACGRPVYPELVGMGRLGLSWPRWHHRSGAPKQSVRGRGDYACLVQPGADSGAMLGESTWRCGDTTFRGLFPTECLPSTCAGPCPGHDTVMHEERVGGFDTGREWELFAEDSGHCKGFREGEFPRLTSEKDARASASAL